MLGIFLKAYADRWVTINGTHVLINEKGSVLKGPSNMIGTSVPQDNRKAEDFLPEDSFLNKDSFKKIAEEWSETESKEKELFSKYQEREKEIEEKAVEAFKKEYPDVEVIDFGDMQMAKSLGKSLISEKNEYQEEWLSTSKKAEELHRKLSRIRKREGKKQVDSYFSESHPVTLTDNVDFEGFNVKTTGTSFGDDYLKKHPENIAIMSPKEYIERSAYEIFEAPIEGSVPIDKNLDEYVEMMKQGVKFDLPYLNYDNGNKGQEGRHRAIAAYMAGIDKIPVLVMSNDISNIGSKREVSKEGISPTTGEKYPSSITTPSQRRQYTILRNSGMSKKDAEIKVKNSSNDIDKLISHRDLENIINDMESEKLNLNSNEKDIFNL